MKKYLLYFLPKSIRSALGRFYVKLFIKFPLYLRSPIQGIRSEHTYGFLNDEWFKKIVKHANEFVGSDYGFEFRIHQALWCASTADKTGIFVELGTGKGFTFSAVAEFLAQNKETTECYLFDTFSPYKTNKLTGLQSADGKKSKFYDESDAEIKEKFRKYPNVKVIKGHCPQVLTETELEKITFLHVDLNYHEVEISSLAALWDQCAKGCIFLLDDYANFGRDIQRVRFDDFFNSKGIYILTLASGQGIAIK